VADAIHEVSVEKENRVPLVERSIEPVRFDRSELHAVSIEIEALRIFADAEYVWRDAAE